MDLHNQDRTAGDTAAGAPLTPGRDGRLMCAQCVGLMMLPNVTVRAYGGGDAEPLERQAAPGPTLVRAAAAAVDAGRMLTIDHSQCGVYAVTTVRGTACCAAHLYVVANESGRGFPFYL